MECAAAGAGSLWLDAGELHHLGPLLSFLRDKLAKVAGQARIHCRTKLGGPSLDLGIGKGSVDLAIKLVDDWGGRAPWCSNRYPRAGLETRQILGHGGNFRERFRSCSGSHRERPQLASPNVLYRC